MSQSMIRCFKRIGDKVESVKFTKATAAQRYCAAAMREDGVERVEYCVVEVSDAQLRREAAAKAKAKKTA